MLYCNAAPHLHFFFFFNDTATTEIYTLSLHDALPISAGNPDVVAVMMEPIQGEGGLHPMRIEYMQQVRALCDANGWLIDRKSTRLNSSHLVISYAVFCLKKKKCITRCIAVWMSAGLSK